MVSLDKINEIKKMAYNLGWEGLCHQKNIYMIAFKRGSERVNIYYSKMTVGTCVTHPTKGRTQLFRKKVSMKQLEKILDNPRVHTRKGYYKKGE